MLIKNNKERGFYFRSIRSGKRGRTFVCQRRTQNNHIQSSSGRVNKRSKLSIYRLSFFISTTDLISLPKINFLATEPDGSAPLNLKTSTGHDSELLQHISHPQNLFYNIHFNVILFHSWYSKWYLSKLLYLNLNLFLVCPILATCPAHRDFFDWLNLNCSS